MTTRVKLSEVRGSLRVAPNPGASAYHAYLQFEARLSAADVDGELTPNVLLESSGGYTGYHPLLGSFPPSTITGMPSVDAGSARR